MCLIATDRLPWLPTPRLVTSLSLPAPPPTPCLLRQGEADHGGRGGGAGAGAHATHLSYQVSVFRVDQDHSSQSLKEGEGFIELRREKRSWGRGKRSRRERWQRPPPSLTLPSTCRPLRQWQWLLRPCRCSTTRQPWKGPSLDPDPLQIQKQEAGLGQNWSRSRQGRTVPLAPLLPSLYLLLSFWICSIAEPVDRDTWCEQPIAVLLKSCN